MIRKMDFVDALVPPIFVDCELLKNNSFDIDLADWFPWNAVATPSGGNAEITGITGVNSWDAGFAQTGVILEQGKLYSISFRARAAANRTLVLKVGQSVAPFTGYTFETVNLTPTMQTFNLSFAMTDPSDINANFEFQLGESSADVTFEYASLQEDGCNNCPSAGTPCDDGNPATVNDVEDGNCNCAGTVCQVAGTTCDDNDGNTTNDVENGFCICSGTYTPTNCEGLTNVTFDSDVTSWNTWNLLAESIGGIANLTAINGGVNIWDAGFNQGPVTFTETKSYTIRLRAKADANREITVKASQSVTPFTSYHLEPVNLTTAFQTFTITFTMASPTDATANLDFLLGANNANIYFDYISLEEDNCGTCPAAGTPCNDNNPATFNDLEDGNCNCSGTPCPTAGTSCDDGDPNTINDTENGFCVCSGTPIQNNCEKLVNGGFDTDITDWNWWACTPSSVGGVANLTAISAAAVNTWDAGFNQGFIALEQGKDYTVTFRARADAARSVVVKVGLAVTPFTAYTFETINLTTSMQVYTVAFSMIDPDDASANLDFLIGGNTANIYLDYVNLTEDNCGSCPAAGTPCDDGNPNTYNDAQDGNCNCVGQPCMALNVFAFLEGSYDVAGGSMLNVLNIQRQLLPGMAQNNSDDGHPYSGTPWNYNGTEGQGWTSSDYSTDAVDWVLVSLRSDVSKASEVFRAAGLILKDGSIQWTEDCRLTNLTGSYYVVIEHRNHIAAMSTQPVSADNGAITYDFRNSDSYKTNGFGQKQLDAGVYGLFVGDVEQITDISSYDINASDKALFEADNGQFSKYLPADFNQDGDVNGADKILWFMNNGIFSSVPK